MMDIQLYLLIGAIFAGISLGVDFVEGGEVTPAGLVGCFIVALLWPIIIVGGVTVGILKHFGKGKR